MGCHAIQTEIRYKFNSYSGSKNLGYRPLDRQIQLQVHQLVVEAVVSETPNGSTQLSSHGVLMPYTVYASIPKHGPDLSVAKQRCKRIALTNDQYIQCDSIV